MRLFAAFVAVMATVGAACTLEPLPIPVPVSDAGPDAPQCAVDSDCDDGNPCTDDYCQGGACTHETSSAGNPCDDSDACNGAETCDGNGACVPGTPVSADDGNACTTDACDPATGNTTHTPQNPCLT